MFERTFVRLSLKGDEFPDGQIFIAATAGIFGSEQVKGFMNIGLVSCQSNQSADSAAILQRIAQGDKSAVQDCLNTYGRVVWDLAQKFTNRREDAEDLVQEVFVDIWKNAARFDATKSPEWVFVKMIARRRIIDFLRKSYRRPQTVNFEEALEGQANDDYRKLNAHLDIKSVIGVLNRLKAQEYKLIQLSIYGGMSHSEIAKMVGLPVGTVKSHIRRGLKKIKKSFGLREFEGAMS